MSRKKYSSKDYLVTAEDKKKNPGKTAIEIVNERIGKDDSPARKVSSRERSNTPSKHMNPKNGTGGSLPIVPFTSNPGINAINQAQFAGTNMIPQFQNLNPAYYDQNIAQDFSPGPRPSREEQVIQEIENQAALRQTDNRGGFRKASDAMLLALNPWSDEKIKATSDNFILNWGLEAAANDPYTTAFVATAGYGLMKALFTKLLGGGAGAVSQAGNGLYSTGGTTATGASSGTTTLPYVTNNPATLQLFKSGFIKAGFTVAAIYTILKDAGDSYIFGNFQVAESTDKLAIAESAADNAGRFDLVSDIQNLRDQIINPTGWERLKDTLPWLTAWKGTQDNIKAAVKSSEVYSELRQDEREAREKGLTKEDKWAEAREKQAAQEKELIDYYNDQRKILEKELREAEKEERKEAAEFWLNYKKELAKMEERQRQAQAEFWIEYKRQLAMLEENKNKVYSSDFEAPSRLNFGLL